MTDPIKLRVIFMGTSVFAERILDALLGQKYNIISVYTRSDKKTGRDNVLKKSAVKILAEKNKLKIFEIEKFDEKTVEDVRTQKPDLIIVAAYGKILPASVLSIPGFGCLNVHASLLPKFRGPSPIQNAILSGETESGATIMLMDAGIDTGDILSEIKTEISPHETYESLQEKISKLSSALLLKTLDAWVERKIQARPQDDSKATYCQLIERQDGQIIWAKDASAIYNRYRAFQPWPGIFTFWGVGEYNLRLKLHRISLAKNNAQANHKIGEVFKLNEAVAVQTGHGAILLEELQLEGKDKTSVSDFLNGHPDFISSVLK